MKTMFKILDESPTRRVIFTSERELKFPQSFLEIRWIEDEPVVDRALQVELLIIIPSTEKKQLL